MRMFPPIKAFMRERLVQDIGTRRLVLAYADSVRNGCLESLS